MTQWENRRVPEGINVGGDHPLKDFAAIVLTIAAGAVEIFVLQGLLTVRMV